MHRLLRHLVRAAALGLLLIASTVLATDHTGTIAEDDYWVASGNPHVIVGTVTVAEGAQLLIGPGVEVRRSNQYCSLLIEGALTADGDPGNEVLFTADDFLSGSQVEFTESGSGSLEYCIIEQANYGVNLTYTAGQVTLFGTTVRDCSTGIRANGGVLRLASTTLRDNSYGLDCWNIAPQLLDNHVVVTGNGTGIRFYEVPNLTLTTPLTVSNSTGRGIWLANCSLPTIDNVTLTGNASYGAFCLENCGDFMLGAGNVIGGAGQENAWPVTIKLGSYPAAGCVIPATGNLNNDIRVDGGISSVNGTWRKLPGLDYVVTNSRVTVSAGGTLTIEPGVTIRHEYVNSGQIIVEGTLIANGAPGSEILFTREAASYWGGIIFQEGGSGSLTHCVVERAGRCVAVDRNETGTITITDTQFQSSSSGLLVLGGNVLLGSTTFSVSSYGIECAGVVPYFLDGDVKITGGSYGLYIEDVPNLELTTPLEITGATQAGVFLFNCLDPLVDNLVVIGCGGSSSYYYGAFYVDRCGDFTLGSGNVIGGEGQENAWPVTIRGGAYPSVDCVIPAMGNINNDIRVQGYISNGNSGTWRKFAGLDYVVTATPTISAGDTLTIDPGVEVLFDAANSFSRYGVTVQGTLVARGESGQEILFTRYAITDWIGIEFEGSGSGDLSHCLFEFADRAATIYGTGTVTVTDCVLRDGQQGLYASSGTVRIGSTTIAGMSAYGLNSRYAPPIILDENVTIVDCTTGIFLQQIDDLNLMGPLAVSGSSFCGVNVYECTDSTIDNLVVTDCTGSDGALRMDNCGDFTLGSGNVIGGVGQENSWPLTIRSGSYPSAECVIPASGNINNDIRVNGGSSTSSGTWRKFSGLDYVVAATTTVSAGGSLAIEPGVQVRFAGNCGIGVQGMLQAVGAPGQEIVFTRNGTSNWANLSFTGTGSGTLDHCTVEFASNGVYQTGTGTVTITDSILRNGGYGVRATGGTVELSRNVITGNTEYGVYLSGATPVFGNEQQQWNDIYGNGAGRLGRGLRNGTADINAPYVYWGTTDAAEISLAIQDRYDDPSLGIVDFLPYCDADHEDIVSGVGDQAEPSGIPAKFELGQGVPNPFNPATLIRFDTTRPSNVRLTIHDIAGRTVATLVDGLVVAGRHQHTWNGCDDSGRSLPSGVYFSRIDSAEGVMTRKLALIR